MAPLAQEPAFRFSSQHRRTSLAQFRRHTEISSLHSLSGSNSSPNLSSSERSSAASTLWSESSSDSEAPVSPATDSQPDDLFPESEHVAEVDLTRTKGHHASTKLLTQDAELLGETVGDKESGTQLIQKFCCGGGCCMLNRPVPASSLADLVPFDLPDNDAFRSLGLKLAGFSRNSELTNLAPLPSTTVTFTSIPNTQPRSKATVLKHPPSFVKPHPPYDVFSAPLFHARELTKPGAEKRTFHFDIDVTDYPAEGDIDFKVGGAVGVCPPNPAEDVEEILDVLGVPKFIRDKPVLMETMHGRWPTIWGDEKARELVTTRREVLTWCSDIQSYPPTKQLLRLFAEHATDENEKRLLLFLCSGQGQPVFCDLRTGAHLSLVQLLHAFPSAKPPLEQLVTVLKQLMPRFYSLSNDPHVSSDREGLAGRRLIEVAVTVHETPDWRGDARTGVGSGFLERLAEQFIEAEKAGTLEQQDIRIPMFRGLMANPLSKEFGVSNGPMMLIGAGVGMAPFRGFILNRLRNANCASKIWLVQGVRDSNLDELYSGELGKYESQIKKVVQSRAKRRSSSVQRATSETDLKYLRDHNNNNKKRGGGGSGAKAEEQWTPPVGETKYVQDEVRQQGDIVWDVINSVDGRVFVCGSSKGMGEGVEEALKEIAMKKGGFGVEGAKAFWEEMKGAGKYIAETW